MSRCEVKDDYFQKFPLQLRDPSMIYNRIMSLFSQQIRIPNPFAHFGEKVVWHIWQERKVFPEFTENPSDEVRWELWALYKELAMLEEETPGAWLTQKHNARFKGMRI